tara:strand:+ start:2074 stop:2376 length:303 start_codon:yes stop_codon:yes gene_type:complete
MATNNSTLESEIVGSTIRLTAEIQLIAGRDRAFDQGVGQMYRAVGSGSFQPVGPQTTITPTGQGTAVNETIVYTDSAVTNQTTYKYYYEIDINERSAIYE